MYPTHQALMSVKLLIQLGYEYMSKYGKGMLTTGGIVDVLRAKVAEQLFHPSLASVEPQPTAASLRDKEQGKQWRTSRHYIADVYCYLREKYIR